jgi:hypothetical protein
LYASTFYFFISDIIYQVQALGLRRNAPSLEELEKLGVKIIRHLPGSCDIKFHTWLIDAGNEDLDDKDKKTAIVPDGAGWYIVGVDESVVFVDDKGEFGSG